MVWTAEDNLVNGLFFWAAFPGHGRGHAPIVLAGVETSETGAEAVNPDQWALEGGQGMKASPWILKSLARKVVFLVSSGKNEVLPHLAP